MLNVTTTVLGVNLPVDTLSGFRWWALQKPHAHKLLREITFRWRGSRARKAGKPGTWAAWPRSEWCKWTGLSLDQLKRALAELGQTGLIERERGRFKGTTIYPFLRPTILALGYVGRPQDINGLMAPSAPTAAPTAAPITAPIAAPISAPTDYTSFPSLPTDLPVLEGVSPSAHAVGTPLSKKDFGQDKQEPKGGVIHPGSLQGSPPSPPVAALQLIAAVDPALATKPVHLAAIWHKAIVDTYGAPPLALTAKERGQLGNILNRCPPGSAGLVLDHAVREWDRFTAAAKADAAAFALPDRPAVAFLLRFLPVAVDTWREDAKWATKMASKAALLSAPKPTVQPAAKVARVAKVDAEPKMTSEQFFALMGYKTPTAA